MIPFLLHSECRLYLELIDPFLWHAGKVVDGREIMVQFAKYGPNAESMWVYFLNLFLSNDDATQE